MGTRDRLKGLMFLQLEDIDARNGVLWIRMAVKGEDRHRAYVRYDVLARSFTVRRAHTTYWQNGKQFFRNKRFIDAVVAKIPDHIIAELTAHSIAFSARSR